MRAAAGLACLVLLTGCGAARSPAAEVASPLTWGADIAEDFEALPRVAGDSPADRAINAFLDGLDARDRESRSNCLTEGPENAQWGRSVAAPMTGPRFVSIIVTRGDYCGGAHPNWSETHYTFDLLTGTHVDWPALLPAGMSARIHEPEYSWPATLASPSLTAWFAQRALAGLDRDVQDTCASTYGPEGRGSLGLGVWLDAKENGLGLQLIPSHHAEIACVTSLTIPAADLRRRGVSAELVDAIETAHRERLWRDRRPESEAKP